MMSSAEDKEETVLLLDAERLDLIETLKRLTSVVLMLLFLTTNLIIVTLPTAFLPVEIVEVRGLPTILTGVVMAANPLTNSLSSFFNTELADKLSLSFKGCMVLAGLVAFLPSLVFVVPITNNVLYVVLVILLRMLQGFVQGMIGPQTVGAIYSTFPNNIGLMVAICEFSIGVSMGAGAAVGSAVYTRGTVGAPFAPFIGFGTAGLVMSVANYFYPHPALYEQKQAVDGSDDGEGTDTSESNDREASRISKFLQSPLFCIGVVLALIPSVIITYYNDFIGLYFVQVYDSPVSEAGIALLLGAVVYGISGSLLGILTDRGLSRMFCIVAGLVVIEISVVLYAPAIIGIRWTSVIAPALIFILPTSIASSAVTVNIVPLLILHDSEQDHMKSSQNAAGKFFAIVLVGNIVGSLFIAGLLDITGFSVVSFILAAITTVALIYLLAIQCKTGNLLTIKAS